MRKVPTIAVVAALTLFGIATARAAVPRDAEEARIALPRTASGTIDVPELITELRAAITRGAREIRFRDTALSESEAARLRELAERFGFEGVHIREQGRRVRVDFRERDQVAADRGEDARPERMHNPEPVEHAARPEKPERAERPEKAERAQRPEKSERPERHGGGDRPDRSGRH